MGTLPLTLAGAFCLVAYGTGRRTAGSLALAVSALAWTGLHGFAVTSMIAVPKDAAVVKVGDAAPDFTLLDTSGAPVRLADARAEGPVALVFFRGAW
jgi:hypothetical protein